MKPKSIFHLVAHRERMIETERSILDNKKEPMGYVIYFQDGVGDGILPLGDVCELEKKRQI